MGIALNDIPKIGALSAPLRRQLARDLRQLLPRGTTKSVADVTAWLSGGPWAGEATVLKLTQLEWLHHADGMLHADMQNRRLAAGAVDGARMSKEEAAGLAVALSRHIAGIQGELGGVRVVRALLYGSSVRSYGNVREDIGDLDLAFEIEVLDPELKSLLMLSEPGERWRTAMDRSGWTQYLMQGDDRITVAGSAIKVLQLFWHQVHGRHLMEDARPPALITLWEHPSAQSPKSIELGSTPGTLPCEHEPLDCAWSGVLEALELHTLDEHPCAWRIAERL